MLTTCMPIEVDEDHRIIDPYATRTLATPNYYTTKSYSIVVLTLTDTDKHG